MSIADKLNYLITTKGLLKDNINKINNVLTDNSTFRSYPQELFNGYLDILNNGTDTLWSNLEKVSQTGTEAVLEGVETAPMKVELQGNTAQNGEPTPDTPIPVQVVTGENVVSVSGKNLFDVPEEYKVVSNIANIPISIEAGEYIISVDSIITDGSTDTSSIIFYYEDGTQYATIYLDNTNKSRTLNFTKKVTKYNIYSQSTWTASQGVTATLNKLMIRSQSIADDTYVPYSKTDYPISLGTIELCKIGNYKDYLFKRNGKWFKHKEINKVVFNGSEFWGLNTTKQITQVFRVNNSAFNFKEDSVGYCNYFINQAGDTEKFSYIAIETYMYFSINKTRASSVAEFKNWLSSHNTILYYPIATPTEEEITDTTLIEQLEAISKAKSVKDKTYITQTNDELPFILDVEAIKEYEVN